MFPDERKISQDRRVASIARNVSIIMSLLFIALNGAFIASACGLERTDSLLVGLGICGLVFANRIFQGVF